MCAAKCVYLLEALLFLALFQLVGPLEPVGLVAQVLGVHVDHATAGDGGGRGVLQVAHLEQHGAVVLQADALAVGQREQLVVVHDRVHVLDPEGVDVAVVEDVAAGLGALGQRAVDLAEDVGEEAVRPVAGVRVQDTCLMGV